MIILTTPIKVPSELGSAATVSYDKLRVISINADPFSITINAQVQLMISTNSAAPVISGSLSIVATGATPNVILQIPTLNFYSGLSLSGASLATVQSWITTLQNNIEAGLINVSMIAGIQSTGI